MHCTRARRVATSTATKSRRSRLPPSSPPATKANGTVRIPLPAAQLKSRNAEELRVPQPVLASLCGLAPTLLSTTKLSEDRSRSTRAVGHDTVRLFIECSAIPGIARGTEFTEIHEP